METAVIKNIQGNGSWTTKDNVVMNKFDVDLDNGKTLTKYLAEGQKWSRKIGDKITYDKQEADSKNKLKEISASDEIKDQKIQRGVAIKAAASIFTASKDPNVSDKVIQLAKKLEEYLQTGL